MTESVREKSICPLLTDDEIRWLVDQELLLMSQPVKSMVLTWTTKQTDYVLEIVLTGETPDFPKMPERRSVEISRVGSMEQNALNKLVMLGRRLYFRLRGNYPLLHRRLSTYRYLAEK